MNIDTTTAIWSGAVVFWAIPRDDDSPANFVHRCFSREVWRESTPWMRLRLCVAFLLRPFAILALAAFFTWRNGYPVKRRTGKGFARQMWEEIRLAITCPILPAWYYIFELYENKKKKNVKEYLTRFETKYFLYKFLRKYSEEPPPNSIRTTEYLSNKASFVVRCREYGLPAVPVLMVVERGKPAPTDGGPCALPRIDLFLKPVRGSGGRGAERWDYAGRGCYRDSRGVVRTEAELLAHLRTLSLEESYMVRPRVVNHPDIADLSNGALSTVRVMTCRNEHDRFEVTNAVFRMACGSNTAVDNFHAGGIVAKVDIATGMLGRAVEGGQWGCGTNWHDRHPDIGTQILGRRLPCWQETLDLARRAHAVAFSDQVLVGWDVALLDDGPHLVEGNKGPCVDLLQKPHEEPLGNARLGTLLAFNLKRALAIKYARHDPFDGREGEPFRPGVA